MKTIAKYTRIRGAKILEIGCGYGAFTSLLSQKGALVVGTEIDDISLKIARKFLGHNRQVKLVKVADELLPFKKNYFDVVVMFDVIEHVKNPKRIMQEIYRVLKNHGTLYIEFTPYYSLIGHHLYDITVFPIHIFSKKYIRKFIYQKVKNKRGIFGAKEYWENFKSLNQMKISKFQEYAKTFDCLEERFLFRLPHWGINIPFFKYLRSLKDIFTFSFEGIYRKNIIQDDKLYKK